MAWGNCSITARMSLAAVWVQTDDVTMLGGIPQILSFKYLKGFRQSDDDGIAALLEA